MTLQTFPMVGHLRLTGVAIEDGSMTFTGIFNTPNDAYNVNDRDGSGTATPGDDWSGVSIPYSGFTVEIGGETYALFQVASTPTTFYIPHQGELTASSLASPVAVTEDSDAEVFNYCFAEGTRIATPAGAVAVEALGIGDPVLTADGRVVAVKWVGRQTVSTRFHMAERLQPVRVRAGALGGGLPERDLVLTADHALLVDGLLVNAGALVNGGSIDWVPVSELGERFTVYHVETEDHDIILAEGAPAETFIDYVGRQAFDNYAEYVALYGEERIITEAPYPRISTPRLLPPARKARLRGAAAA
jgi:hypothetical protein